MRHIECRYLLRIPVEYIIYYMNLSFCCFHEVQSLLKAEVHYSFTSCLAILKKLVHICCCNLQFVKWYDDFYIPYLMDVFGVLLK